MSGKTSQRKGANGERELATRLREEGFQVRRGQVFNHESDLIGLEGILPEVKRVEKLNVWEAINQAIREAIKRKDGIPILFHRRNKTGMKDKYEDWLVTMRFEDWVEFYRKWKQ